MDPSDWSIRVSAKVNLKNGMQQLWLGGAYFMQDSSGHKYVSVFKPIDEEPMAVNNPHGLPVSVDGEGLKKGTHVGKGALREVAAYILDYPMTGARTFPHDQTGFAGVPPTTMVKCLHKDFNHPNGYSHSLENTKIGSLQMFVSNVGTCEDMDTKYSRSMFTRYRF